jgi:putative ABC transport system substrate-binding protein
MVAELLRLPPDVLVTMGPRPATVARDATRTVPVVAIFIDDPVAMGLAESLARPGRNFTGVSAFGIELIAKRLELMKQLVPAARRIGILTNPITVPSRNEFEANVRPFERDLDIRVVIVEAKAPMEFDAAFEALARQGVDGVLVVADATFFAHRARLAELCRRHNLPSVWGGRDYLEGGGLASYQSDVPHMFRRGAYLTDAVLRGAKPAETPFERATKLELALNLKAARALGLAVPRSVLAAADLVIE